MDLSIWNVIEFLFWWEYNKLDVAMGLLGNRLAMTQFQTILNLESISSSNFGKDALQITLVCKKKTPNLLLKSLNRLNLLTVD